MRNHLGRSVALALSIAIAAAGAGACSSSAHSARVATSTTAQGSAATFPVTVHAANGSVTIGARPTAIVSLSPTATEMLAAMGALPQVKAVDKDSNFPAGVPKSGLDATQPNVEAIAAFHPDLLVMAGDTNGLVAKLATFKIPVLSLPAANTLDDTYNQVRTLGQATGHVAEANQEVSTITSGVAQAVAAAHRSGPPLTYYYELDQTYYSVTSSTFIGSVLGMLGLKSIADPAAKAADGGYPQLSAEYIIKADPAFILLADSGCCAQSPATVAARPGWAGLHAVIGHHVVVLNDDIASRWGPRVVDLAREVAAATTP